jgi:hypothetical protein
MDPCVTHNCTYTSCCYADKTQYVSVQLSCPGMMVILHHEYVSYVLMQAAMLLGELCSQF